MTKKRISKSKFSVIVWVFTLTLFMGMIPTSPEEGMYPLSEISKLDVVKAGLKIAPKEIYNPDGVSLIDGLVHIGGCTGSFVSADGLIITNHHCAFGAISGSSTPEKNYLRDGFSAVSKEEEVPARGYTVSIMESYKDVSEEVLSAVEGIEDLSERYKKIGKKMREIAKEASDKEKSISSEVSEMFLGQTYILFNYRIIRDVRLVYAPPAAIGNFGGETDNWMWPRHTCDFSFMRAYVAPDGSAASYSKENIPFHPKKHLKINAKGVKEGDFAFILGYPGRTYRHRPSQFLEYQQKYQLPYTAQLYEWLIAQLEDVSGNDEALKLATASYIKSLANTSKNYRGKLLGLQRIKLVDKKRSEEKELENYIKSDKELSEKYSMLFPDIQKTYDEIFKAAKANLWFRSFFRFSNSVNIADFISAYTSNMKLPNLERKKTFREENLERTLSNTASLYRRSYPQVEERFLLKMLSEGLKLKGENEIIALQEKFAGENSEEKIRSFVKDVIENSKLLDKEFLAELVKKPVEEIEKIYIPLRSLVEKLNKQFEEIEKRTGQLQGALSKLSPQLIEVKKIWKKTSFIPDANSTLRFTYGYIKGYNPADATYYSPITSLEGVIDKANRGISDYKLNDKLKELYDKKDFGKFKDEKLGSIPVALLYNMDTTGGNSGSPILNAYGELIGVNFDRAYEATINDYAWNEAYSRSIGVDIRYVLWITQKIGNSAYLLDEMGLNL